MSFFPKLFVSFSTILAIAASPPTLAQFDIPDVDIPDIPDTNLPDLSNVFEEEPPLTTSLYDVRGVPLLDGEEFGPFVSLTTVPQRNDAYLAPPGAYEITLQSYCLHAGTYGPEEGSGQGYGYASLEGPRSDIISTILENADNHPDLEQSTIQTLIWAILARTNLQDTSDRVRSAARQLLSDDQIDEINGNALDLIPDEVRNEVLDSLPSEVRRVVAARADLRRALTEADSTYEELEDIAVLTGAVPENEGETIPEERWSLHPDGYFVRYSSSSYRQTTMQVLVPRPSTLDRDSRGRITAIDYGDGYRLETDYDDTVGAIAVPGEPDMKIYFFSAMRLVSPDRTVTVRDRGWTFVGIPETGEARFDELEARSSAFSKQSGSRRIDVQEAKERYEDARSKAEKVKETAEDLDGEVTKEEAQEILDRDHYKDGAEVAAENDPEAKGEWLGEHFKRAQQAWAYAIDKIRDLGPDDEDDSNGRGGDGDDNGDDSNGNGNGGGGTTPVDPGDQTAVPSNPNSQRLGLSELLGI